MKRVLFVLAAIAILAAGGFAMAPSAHADGGSGGGTPQSGSSKC